MRADATWFRDAQWGVFVHYLADDATSAKDWNAQVDAFDVEGLADQLEQCKAPYFFLTLGQNSGHYCSPNATYDSIVGIKPGKCSRRDLVADLYQALAPRGIRMMVYLPAGAPDRDPVAMEKLQWQPGKDIDEFAPPNGMDENGVPWGAGNPPNIEFQKKWQAVIREWSVRWGNNVHGWWFDGCYFARAMYRRPEPPNFESFAASAKAGNPNSLVAFNPGVLTPVICYTEHEEYTAGEIAEALPVGTGKQNTSRDGKVDGAQYHILSYLGINWSSGPRRFPDDLAVAYTRYINSLHGVVTWDVPTSTTGRIPDDFLHQLERIGNSTK